MSGNTECTPPGSTPVLYQREEKLPLGCRSETWSLIAYLTLSAIRTMLLFDFINTMKLSYPALCSHLNTLYVYTPAVLLLAA